MVYYCFWWDSHCPTRSSSLLRSRKLSYRKVSNSFTSTARSAHSGGGWPSTLKPKNWVWHRAFILGSGLSKNMRHMLNMFFSVKCWVWENSHSNICELIWRMCQAKKHSTSWPNFLISKGLIQFFSPNLPLAWWLKLKNGHGSTWLTKITWIYN